MATMPAVTDAITFARAHPQFSFGAHLTMTGDGPERPISPPEQIPGLVRLDGSFRATRELRLRALAGRLCVAEIAREISAQLAFLRDHGVPLSHADSHRHLHKLGPFRAALREVLPRFSMKHVRTAQDVYLARPLTTATYWLGPRWRARLASSFTTTEHFYMPSSTGDRDWEAPLVERIASLAGTTLEVGVHPGPEGWRRDEARSVVAFAAGAWGLGHVPTTWWEIDA
jgi:predicted glycoside hydrolase/deacetylase ChbG (UPF0249 family)